jgi:hypothetical protein
LLEWAAFERFWEVRRFVCDCCDESGRAIRQRR